MDSEVAVNELPAPTPDLPSAGPPLFPPPAQVAARKWREPKKKRWVWFVFAFCALIAVGAVRNLVDGTPTNAEVRDDLTNNWVAAGLSPAQALCWVDGLDARFDLTGDLPKDSESTRFMFRTLYECGGAGGEMLDCMVDSTLELIGDGAALKDLDGALVAFGEVKMRLVFEAGGRCAGLDDAERACVTERLLDEYPNVFEQEGLTREQQDYVTNQIDSCVT